MPLMVMPREKAEVKALHKTKLNVLEKTAWNVLEKLGGVECSGEDAWNVLNTLVSRRDFF